MSASLPSPTQGPGAGASDEKPGKVTVALTRFVYLALGGSFVGGLVQGLFGVVLLSVAVAALCVGGVCGAWAVTRFKRSRNAAAPGWLARFLSTRAGHSLQLALLILGIAGLLALTAWMMKTCPRADEGLC
ncbi:hypothetical protein [Streptomyces sp. ODS28]|uniref:hypothetical protein n=1 Tax=Streptomyces sp. ODS28 TaxID=3136688 RepID=UPI0031E7D961